MSKITVFTLTRDLLSNVEVGKTITRQEILSHIGESLDTIHPVSVDNYRRLFCKVHYFEGNEKGGTYTKLKEFDKEITKKDLDAEYNLFVDTLFHIHQLKKSNRDEITRNADRWKELNQWGKLWKESGLSAKDFLHQKRGRITAEKFNF